MSDTARQQAADAFQLLDLTSLTNTETPADIAALCDQAAVVTPAGEQLQVAALCLFPRYLPLARKLLDERGLYQVRLATVANFPAGEADLEIAVKETRACVAYGADEVDVVFPYGSLLAGEEQIGYQLVQACKTACGQHTRLKVILETGELKTPELMHKASELAIAAGADFIKTSTGKVTTNATPEAARIMLAAISQEQSRPVGFKPAGGIKTLDDALVYMQAVTDALGADALTPARFRIGASSVRQDLAAIITGSEPTPTTAGGY